MAEQKTYDQVIRGGRVIDPETGLDAVRDVGIDGDTIAAISETPLEGRRTIDATGQIVTAGFIDLHSHAQTVAGHRLQAFDGVTTALDLEAGAAPIPHALKLAGEQGRPLNYGWSASWAMARMHVKTGAPMDGPPDTAITLLGDARWQVGATPEEVQRIAAIVEEDLAAGALGIGMLMGYAQGTGHDEYLTMARLAAGAGAPTYTHARDLVEVREDVLIDGAEEIARAAAETGAHMHYCHVNSTSTRHVDRVQDVVERANAEGSTVTLEAYPYGAGMTGIGAQFLAPDQLAMRGLKPTSLILPMTGERIADEERLLWVREHEPWHQVIVEFVNDEEGLAPGGFLRRALAYPGTVVASDAIFPIDTATGAWDSDDWPLPPTMTTHPRVVGTYTRSLRLLVDEVGLTWSETLERCSLGPARILEAVAPSMKRKGRMQVGCDADIVVFDPERVQDLATYSEPLVTSVGMRHVLVNGEAVIRDGELVMEARPGRAVVARA